ncbi:phosphotransferase [Candidatus Poribacteria bacterium]|nr:phosphotransferase [Candidatus Poribacteria bacterium]
MSAQNIPSYRTLYTAVKGILSEKFGGEIRLEKSEEIHPQQLYRYKIILAPDGMPDTVFVKRKRARRIRVEWACLQFINQQIHEECPIPIIYGGGYIGKNNIPVVVMEDMGEGQNLRGLLSTGDSNTAKTVLRESAERLANIHSATIGQQKEYINARNTIVNIKHDPQDLKDIYSKKFTEICNVTGVTPNNACYRELDQLADFLDPNNQHHGLTHGDLYTVNIYHSTSKSRTYIFDYEFGHYQHVFVDVFQFYVSYDMWADVSRFPTDIIQEMERAYRNELKTDYPEISDDEWFYKRLIEASAFETIQCIYRFFEPPKTVFTNVINNRPAGDYEALRTDPNYNHWGLPAVRRRVFFRLGLLSKMSEEYNHLMGLGETAKMIQEKFKTIWPPEVQEMPIFEVFL